MMTLPDTDPTESQPPGEQPVPAAGAGESFGETSLIPETEIADIRRRRRLFVLLVFLLVALAGVVFLFYRYIRQPAPLPDLLPGPVNLNYPPHYVYSIYNLDKPVGIALSPDGKRLYVAESSGERLIKMLDTEGAVLNTFAPPRTITPERAPVYLAVDGRGRVYVTDRAQHAVFVYDAAGNYLDTFLSPDLALSEYVWKHLDQVPAGTLFAFNAFQPDVYYQEPGQPEASLPAPDLYDWAPLGVRIDGFNRLFLTDVTSGRSSVRIFASSVISSETWLEFDPLGAELGEYGKGNGQFVFPNSVAVDTRGRIFVADSNNSRISVWDNQGVFLFNFGRGTGEGAVNLPRGLALDERQRLYVVDAVGQGIKVYDIASDPVQFLYAFGDQGSGDGQFSYPNDIALDNNGRLYIVDRENNRVQVWMY